MGYQAIIDSEPLLRLFESGMHEQFPLFLEGQKDISWRDFAAQVAGLAEEIETRPEQNWLLCSARPYQMATALFAVWLANRTPVFPPNYQAGTLERLRESFDAAIVDFPVSTTRPMIDVNAVTPSAPILRPLASDLTAIFYTSGSTGDPKRVVKKIRQMQGEICLQNFLWGDGLRDALVISSIPPWHAYGNLYRLLLPLISGSTIDNHFFDEARLFDPHLSSRSKVALVSSPAFLSRIPSLVTLDKVPIKIGLMLSSGAALPSAEAQAIYESFGSSPAELYGSTETGAIAWRRQHQETSWTPMPSIRFQRTESGTLSIHSPYLIGNEWTDVPDLIEVAGEGDRFHLLGRADRIVKVEERRMSLTEMENRLCDLSSVRQAAVVNLDLPGVERTIMGAAIVLTSEGREQLDLLGAWDFGKQLKDHLVKWFELPVVPRQFRYIEQLPINELGKCTAASVRALFEHKA